MISRGEPLWPRKYLCYSNFDFDTFMSSNIMSCQIMSCHLMTCLSCQIMSHHVISSSVMSRIILFTFQPIVEIWIVILLYQVMSYLSCQIVLCHDKSSHINDNLTYILADRGDVWPQPTLSAWRTFCWDSSLFRLSSFSSGYFTSMDSAKELT